MNRSQKDDEVEDEVEDCDGQQRETQLRRRPDNSGNRLRRPRHVAETRKDVVDFTGSGIEDAIRRRCACASRITIVVQKMSILSVALIGKQNEPLYFYCKDVETSENLHLQMIAYSALDVVEEKRKK